MLELKNVCKSFGDVRVLNGVNLSLEKGFVYALKGGNGSGKTTLINIISGFLKPNEIFSYAQEMVKNSINLKYEILHRK
jgi:ABC-type multidrug transport system ATPase subunit